LGYLSADFNIKILRLSEIILFQNKLILIQRLVHKLGCVRTILKLSFR
jgi:hypothetical protein